MAKTLIKNGKIWDGEAFFNSDILTDNGTIALIKNSINSDAEYIYDASGKIVSAGLVDIHTHLLGKYGINAEMSCIPFGVTAVADASAEPCCKENYDNFLVKNKVFVCAEFANNKVMYEKTVDLLEYYKGRAIGLKVYFDTNISEVYDINPLREITGFAHKNNLVVMVHPSNSPVPILEIISVLGRGDILTHTYHGGINNAAQDGYACLKTAREKGVILDTGFAGNVHTDFFVLENAIRSGYIPDTISTDITKNSAYKRGGRYGMTTCMSLVKKLGMSESDIFRCVTSLPSKALSKENEWGYLKVGRCADIAVFDYTDELFSLTDNRGKTVSDTRGYRCVLTMVDGEIVFKD